MQTCTDGVSHRGEDLHTRDAFARGCALIAFCLSIATGPAAAQTPAEDYSPVTAELLLKPLPGDWPMWRRTYSHWGYSPLDQINTTNVGRLRLAWAWTMAEGKQETTPLVHDGIMFLVQACDFVEALDVRDGTRLWQYSRTQVDHAALGAFQAEPPRADAVEWMNTSVTPGEPRKIVTGIPGKTGIVWALDAATGDFLWARPTNFQNVVVDIDAESRRVLLNPDLKMRNVGEPVFVCPSLTGGINWQATAYHPGTNALYAPTNNTCNELTLNEFRLRPGAHHGSARVALSEPPDGDGQIGQFTAVDLSTGETLWVHRQRAGFGGSVLTTGGGLVFVTDDARRFRAFDAQTGEVHWEQILNSSAGGYPVSYMHDGVQYVAIAAGGGVNFRGLTPEIRQPGRGNMLFVFRLP